MKRIIALVLSLVMALSLCAPAWAAMPEAVDGVITLSENVTVAEGVIDDNIHNATYNGNKGESDKPADGELFYNPYANTISSYKFLMGSADKAANITLNGSYTGSNAVLLLGQLTVADGAGIYGCDEGVMPWRNVNVNGGYTFGVGYSTSDSVSATFDGTNPLAQMDLASGAEMARFGHIFVGSDKHDKGENAYVMNIASGATLKDFAQLTTRGDGTINVDGAITSFTTKSYESNAPGKPVAEHAKDGGHSNNNGVINVSDTGSIKIDSMNVGRKPSLNTGNAELNVDGGSFAFTNYVNVGYDGSARIGEVNLSNGAKLISEPSSYTLQYNHAGDAGTKTVDKPAGTLTIGVAATGVVTMDTSSTISVGSINVGDKGSIVIDASGYTGSSKKLIEQTAADATSLEGKVTVNNLPANYGVSYADGDVTITAAVATADGVPYTTLQAALNAGGKVVLLDSITLAEGVTVPAGKTVELDLAGKTISQNKECTESYAMITNKGNLTIAGNGKITMNDSGVNSGSSWGVYTIRNEGGKLIVENGTIENIAPNSTGNVNNAIFNYSGETTINNGVFSVPYSRTVRVWNGSVTINDGSFDGQVWAQPVNNNGCSLTINGGSFKPATNGNDGSSVYVTNGTYSVTVSVTDGYFATRIGMQSALKCISGGYFNTDPSAYCIEDMTGVTSDKAGYLYMVGEKGVEKPAEVVVATPPAQSDIPADVVLNGTEEDIVDALEANNAIDLSADALEAKAADIANNTSAEATDDHAKALDDAIVGNATPIAKDDVTIVVQPYFDVAIKDVDVVEVSGGQPESVTIKLDITPMYQTVATTATDLDDIDLDGNDKNAVVIGTAKEMTVTEPVKITIKLPTVLVSFAANNNNKLFVTHEASSGTYVYVADVNPTEETATFINSHGFSSFTISATDNTVAEVNSDKYTKLDHALKNVADGGTVTVKKDGQTASVSREVTFTVVLGGATAQPTISAGSGYTMTKEDVTGGVKYTFTKVTGGYYPYYPPTTTPDSELVKSPNTFDAGIALYVGVSVMGAVGTVVLGKKRED